MNYYSTNATPPSDTTPPNDARLTHLDRKGHAHMVDVGSKVPTCREARASGVITLSPRAFLLLSNTAQLQDSSQEKPDKGDVLGVARVAGIMASKHTPSLIPLCHTVLLTHVAVDFDLCRETCSVVVRACVRCEGVTGVEMEALTAVAVTLLTIYDMTKSVDKGHVISDIQLESKSGGKSGSYDRSQR